MTATLNERFTKVLARAAARLDLPGDNPTLTLARQFGIGGFVARHLSTSGNRVEFRHEVLVRRLFERVLLEKASELSSALTTRGIPHFFLKGVVVARWLYEPGERYFVDVDLYVAPEARMSAVDTLQAIGYRELPPARQSGPAELRSGVTLVSESRRAALDAVNLDVHWGIEPVERLLPRADTPLPDAVWHRVTRVSSLPAPAPEHHAALILHHLVHHDLLHIRSLLDFALLCQRLSHDAGQEFEETARSLGVLRVARAVSATLVQDLGLDPPPGIGPAPQDWRGRRLARLLELEWWLTWAGAASAHEHVAVTPRRVARRLLLLDRLGSARHMFADAVWPPREFLRWRWPEARFVRVRHLLGVARKILRPQPVRGR